MAGCDPDRRFSIGSPAALVPPLCSEVRLCRFAAWLLRNYFARRESISSRLSQGGIVERWRTDLSADSDPALGLSFHTCHATGCHL